MKKVSNTESGFTLVEVLVSVGIMLVFLPFAASMLSNSQLLSSYSKHSIEAVYAAQQIIETQRQGSFIALTQGQSKTIGPASVILDTKGNYGANVTCANANVFCGVAVITVTPTVYNNAAGVPTTSNAVDHFVVMISWTEQVAKVPFHLSETYAEDVANDPMLN